MPSWYEIRKNCVLTCAAVAFMSRGLAQTGTGKISGIVIGSDGKPLTAIITAARTGIPTASAPARVQSAVDGSFILVGLAAGGYQLCAVAKGGYLDPCVWSAGIFPLQLSSGQAITGYRLTLEKGSTLQVRVNDPSGALDQKPEAGKVAPHVAVGLFTSRHLFQPLALAGKDQGGKDLEGTIPFDKTVHLHLVGKGVQVTSSTGGAVDLNGATFEVMHTTGMAPLPLTFNVDRGTP